MLTFYPRNGVWKSQQNPRVYPALRAMRHVSPIGKYGAYPAGEWLSPSLWLMVLRNKEGMVLFHSWALSLTLGHTEGCSGRNSSWL